MGDLDRDERVPVVVDVADWLRIDAVMDNEIQNLREKCWESDVPDQLNPFWVELTELAEASGKQAGITCRTGPRPRRGSVRGLSQARHRRCV